MPLLAPFRVLLVAERASDAVVTQQALSGESVLDVIHVEGLAKAMTHLVEGSPVDVVLLELDSPDHQEVIACERIHREFPNHPIVVLTDAPDEELGIAVIRAGAQEYLVKAESLGKQLTRALHLAIERHRLLYDLQERVKELRGFYSAAMVLRRNELSLSELLQDFTSILPMTLQFPELAVARVAVGELVSETPGYHDTPWTLESRFEASNGIPGAIRLAYVKKCPPEAKGSFLEEERRILGSLAEMLRSHVETRDALGRLRESESQFRVLFEHNPHPMWVFDMRTLEFLAVNDTAVAHYGYSREEFLAMRITDIRPDEDVPALLANIARGAEDYQYDQIWKHRLKDGRTIRAEIHSKKMTFDGRESRLVLALDCTKRIEVEVALQASEASLHKAQRIASIGSWEYDFIHDKLVWSDEVYRIFGIAREDFVPNHTGWFCYVHPDDQSRLDQLLAATLENRQPIDFEYRLVHPDGRVFHVHQRGELTCDFRGRVVRAMGTVQDITERMELLAREQAARREADRASQYYRSLFECAPGSYLVLTPYEFEIVAVSDAYLGATRTTREEVSGKNLFEVFFPNDPESPIADGARSLRESLERVQWTGRSDAMTVQQYAIRRPADQGGGFEVRYWSSVNSPVQGPNGELAFIIHRVEDVTDYLRDRQQSGEETQAHQELASRADLLEADIVLRSREIQRANERLAQSQIMLRMASSLSKVGGWRIRLPDFEVTWTEEMRLIHERNEEQTPGLNETFNYYAADSRERIRAAFLRCAEEGVSFDEECQMITARKRPIWVRVIGEAVRDDTGKIRWVQGALQDVTEVKNLEYQLSQSRKMEAIGHLAGGVAHDFNNLLTVINGYSEAMMTMLPAGDQMRSMLAEIRQAGDHATNLTRQLLAFSRKQVLTPKVLDINAVIGNLEKLLARLIGEDIHIMTVLQPHVSRIRVDPGQLEQVLINLLVNARDAMPQGGRVTIESANVMLSEDDVAHNIDIKPGPYVALSVSDTGRGISPEDRSHIFEPFYTTKEVGKGTGLGLATVFGVVKQSGGSIDVYSELGIGSRFRILFPAVDAVSHSTANEGATAPKGSETVLLVEDEDGVRRIAKLSLEAQGYRVLEAPNGQQALLVYEEFGSEIDLVISDVVMPEMSGRELAQQLRANRATLKVLYMSGYTDDAIVRHGVLQETDAFLQKPFSPLSLARKVREVLDAPSREETHR